MIIDSCYMSVVEKLTSQGKIKEISIQLMSLNTNHERVLFVYKIFENLNTFPKVQEVKKTDNLSVYYRNLGNSCFIQSEYHKAWQYYNLSLTNATLFSESYCLAISNRSAVFYELEKYKECLLDINTVLSLDYPQKIIEKLTKRKKMCEEHLSKTDNNTTKVESEINKLLTMKSVKDSRYLCASNKLDVLYTNELGRHVIAKENIDVGEVLAQEDPYLTLLLKSQFICACSYCLSRNLNLLPCDSCCFSLYCSNECKEKAWKEYHSIECPLIATLIDMDFTKLELLALRTVIKARQDHNNWNSLFETIQFADANYNTEFRGHVKINDEWVYDSKSYVAIHTLATNIEKRSISDIFQKAVSAVVLLRFLEMNTEFLKIDCEKDYDKIRNTVAGLLLLHLMTSPTNMHGISGNIETEGGKFVEEAGLASAAYAFCSLINHSCAPNVVRISKLGTGKLSLFAIRPIKKGMQIFDNYGVHYALENRKSRQDTLQFQYKFICRCEACINNWPTYFALSLRPIINVPSKLSRAARNLLTKDTIENLERGNVNTAVKIYEQVCTMCNRLAPYGPCQELCDCQESLKQCLAIFEGLCPYGTTQLIDIKLITPIEGNKGNIAGALKNAFNKMTL